MPMQATHRTPPEAQSHQIKVNNYNLQNRGLAGTFENKAPHDYEYCVRTGQPTYGGERENCEDMDIFIIMP